MENIISSAVSGITDTIGSVTGSVVNTVTSGVMDAISHFFYSIVYQIVSALCGVVEILDKLFATLSGTSYVSYDGSKDFLINVFFHNSTINNIYWAMALIGIVLSIFFTIIAVMRKSIDSGDRIRQPLGGILTGLFKSLLMIVSMSALMTVVVYSTNVLMTQVDYIFRNADNLNKKESIEFTDEQFAAMARALDTIGNYSLNPSYDGRYNINSCFNEIRDDLQFLQQTGVFDFYYEAETLGDGTKRHSWQSALQDVASAADLTQDLSMDIYNAGVTKAITSVMREMKTNASFLPRREYTRKYQASTNQYISMDRTIFLIGTMSAAKNPELNVEPSLTDPLRGAYYLGEKSIYSYDDVDKDFDITEISYILLFLMLFILIFDLAIIIMNCVARIFNMLLLYIISPLILSTISLDEGGKLKQWSTAFVVQCFGVMGTIISMRLLLTIMPIIMSSKLVLFEDNFMNLVSKAILILGAVEVSKRASGMITGILADNAGLQSVQAGDMAEMVRQRRAEAWGYTKDVGGLGWGITKGVGGGVWGLGKRVFGSKKTDGGSDGSGGSDGGNLPPSANSSDLPKDNGAGAGESSGNTDSGTLPSSVSNSSVNKDSFSAPDEGEVMRPRSRSMYIPSSNRDSLMNRVPEEHKDGDLPERENMKNEDDIIRPRSRSMANPQNTGLPQSNRVPPPGRD